MKIYENKQNKNAKIIKKNYFNGNVMKTKMCT